MNAGRVLAFGTFDLLHPGHHSYLQQAAALGAKLFVLVACDQAVNYTKAHSPLEPEQTRLKKVAALPYVTRAFLGQPVKSRTDYLGAIKELRPDIIALGYDQFLDHEAWLRKELGKFEPAPKIVRLTSFMPSKYKSSILKMTNIKI